MLKRGRLGNGKDVNVVRLYINKSVLRLYFGEGFCGACIETIDFMNNVISDESHESDGNRLAREAEGPAVKQITLSVKTLKVSS